MVLFKRLRINKLIKKIKALQQDRIHNQPSDASLKKEILLYQQLAELYNSLQGKKNYPYAREMMIECYRAAAAIEDTTSQYFLAKRFIDEARFRENIQQQGIFANTMNERLTKQLYEEAFAYLVVAERLGHVEAKRLYGLCYINGWGVEAEKKRGFELIVRSIEQENSWDKVPQIFAELGLNKPEFFSALTQFRSKS